MNEKLLYEYEGPVMTFDQVLRLHWEGATYAVSPEKAKSNLAFRFKKESNRTADCKISLPGKLYCQGKRIF